ncbi:hypothetical protein Cpir12675_006482 [Ceratocystis pirilliformis]|uniref:BZIP domain-containing protein n=1 Tax=Ceratocystis pirilliformis TaxID=259994 RepID=A0ABR3YGY0_9PEZI
MSITKHNKEKLKVKEDTGGEESMESTPEAEQATASTTTPSSVSNAQEVQQPKRKGGRKPIYATSEERKQRNRQAQAAFRERRTEYIKQLEETIRVHESNLQNLQAAHRTAADECLMLRYKNSLLERILLEKGIDVQAELRAKTGSPNLGPTHMPQNMVQPPPIQRAIMNRHNQNRRPASIATKLDTTPISPLPPPLHQGGLGALPSPRSRPVPSSNHSNSPTAPALTFGGPAALSPAASDYMSSRTSVPPSIKPPHMSPINSMPAPSQVMATHQQSHAQSRATQQAPYYPTPGFQSHIEQLEQEYDAQTEMMDDSELEPSSGNGGYSTYSAAPSIMPSPASTRGSHAQSQSEAMQPQQQQPQQPQPQSQQPQQPGANGGQYPSMNQLLDSGMEWDPFGLSASMAFPTPFAFDQSNMR